MSEWWAALTGIERIFVALALPFSLLTIIQLILELLGSGSDHGAYDGDVSQGIDSLSIDHSAGFFDHFTFFSVRNLIYFFMMFGWTGLACVKCGMPIWLSILIAFIVGLLTMIIIGWIFYMFSKLTESGNVKIKNAVGSVGTVYISIPEKRSGSGVVQLVLQGATQEITSMTDGEKIESGISVEVKEILRGNIALVAKLDK
ncbi:MAG: hypothetical protein HQ568_03205 [Calditrichaeota bacterium]|nr:hypothetical protein [Calditrichota bacterium]